MIKIYDFLYHHNIRKDKNFHQTQLSSDIEGGVYTKKVQILKENLFGVDLDKIATETIQLNLLLKIAEKKHHLPILQKNIRLGNSVIKNMEIDSLAFRWEKEFHQILKNEGGFDVIIGNPPYVRQEKIKKIKLGLKSEFSVYSSTADLYVYFFERGINLLKEDGNLGFIVSNKWLKASYGEKLRKFLANYWITEFIDFGDIQIFKNATTYPCIIILKKLKRMNPKIKVCKIKDADFLPFDKYIEKNSYEYDQKKLIDSGWILEDADTKKILEKIETKGITLEKYTKKESFRGIGTGYNKAFIISNEIKNQIIKLDEKSRDIIIPIITGKEVNRYRINHKNNFLIFAHKGLEIDKYKAIKKHLTKFKKNLESRPEIKEGKYEWWRLSRYSSSNIELFKNPKIVYGDLITNPRFTIDYDGFFTNQRVYIIPTDDKKIVGILNSPFGWFLIKNFCTQIQGGYYLAWDYIRKIPISTRNSIRLEEHVDKMLLLHSKLKKNKESKNNQSIDNIEQQIIEVELKINQEVYKLYELTSDEIKIIENSKK